MYLFKNYLYLLHKFFVYESLLFSCELGQKKKVKGDFMLDVSMMQEFLEKWERVENRGYVPCRRKNYTGVGDPAECGPVLGASGVTIGMGVDLGQQDLAVLSTMKLPDDLLTILSFYVGKRKEAAIDALRMKPLFLDDVDVDRLDDAIFFRYLDRLIKMYDLASSVSFEERPGQVQTVLMSLFYQLGSPYSSRNGWIKIWKDLCAGRWQEAQKKLRNIKAYNLRRGDEADLLSEVIA